MTNELLRKEPTIAHHDDIPVLNDRINVSWEKLSRVLEPVGMPGHGQNASSLSDQEMALVLAGVTTESLHTSHPLSYARWM